MIYQKRVVELATTQGLARYFPQDPCRNGAAVIPCRKVIAGSRQERPGKIGVDKGILSLYGNAANGPVGPFFVAGNHRTGEIRQCIIKRKSPDAAPSASSVTPTPGRQP